jgi:alkylation response protein AidB-like acyl-CoA dehydrogenase
VRFELSDEATALRDAAAGLLAAEVTPAVIRAGWPGGDGGRPGDGPANGGPAGAVWRKLAALGAVGTLVPEEQGGLGLDENSLVPLLEEVGRSGLPGPAVETIAVAAPLLPRPDILAGETLVAVRHGDLVPFGQVAEVIVARDGGSMLSFCRNDLELVPQVTVDGSRLLARAGPAFPEGRARGGTGGYGGSLPRRATVLTDDPAVTEAAWQRGVLGTSALLIGLARRMLELTVGYVKRREQFGVPVGSFQAVKHALASALVAVEFARPVVLAAAWAQAAGAADAARQTSAAKVLASDAARLVARTAIQGHGALGYTTEYELHLFAKRAWALAAAWGDPAAHRALIADSLGVADG